MNDETLRTYYQIITDAWKMLKADLQTDRIDTDIISYWVDRYNYRTEGYRGSDLYVFAGEIYGGCLVELERLWKERRRQQNCTVDELEVLSELGTELA